MSTNPIANSTGDHVTIGNIDVHAPVDGVVWLQEADGDGQAVPEAELAEILQKYFDSRF